MVCKFILFIRHIPHLTQYFLTKKYILQRIHYFLVTKFVSTKNLHIFAPDMRGMRGSFCASIFAQRDFINPIY